MTSTVNILFFARLREQMGMQTLSLDINPPISLATLKAQLSITYPQFSELRPPIMAAINQDFATDEGLIYAGDEVAFFPPVTGG
jgi:sulfur-carrier protein